MNAEHVAYMEKRRATFLIIGQEFEHCSGIRAVAAYHALALGLRSPEVMFDACESRIGNAWLYEGYEHRFNPMEDGIVLGRGLPLASLEAYCNASRMCGRNWGVIAITTYLETLAPLKYRAEAGTLARKWWARASERYDCMQAREVAA